METTEEKQFSRKEQKGCRRHVFTLPPTVVILWSVTQSRQSVRLSLQSSELAPPRPLTRRGVLPPPSWF
jgi:hypothetical protein